MTSLKNYKKYNFISVFADEASLLLISIIIVSLIYTLLMKGVLLIDRSTGQPKIKYDLSYLFVKSRGLQT